MVKAGATVWHSRCEDRNADRLKQPLQKVLEQVSSMLIAKVMEPHRHHQDKKLVGRKLLILRQTDEAARPRQAICSLDTGCRYGDLVLTAPVRARQTNITKDTPVDAGHHGVVDSLEGVRKRSPSATHEDGLMLNLERTCFPFKRRAL